MNATGDSWWWRWLVGATVGVMAFSLAMVLLPGLIEGFFNWLVFSGMRSDTSFTPEARQYIRFVYGVLGAVMFGWMVAIGVGLLGPFRRGEQAAWDALAGSVGSWFVVDSAFSLASGFWENALFNLVFLVLFAVPLAASYRQFHSLEGRRHTAQRT